MADDPEHDAVLDPVQHLAREYAEARRRTGAEWLYVQQPRDDELRYTTFSYLPEQHFRRAYDQITRNMEYDCANSEDVCTCRQCGGPVRCVRTDQRAHLEAEYYRCQAEEGCRQGGERVYDRTGEHIRTSGPVFEENRDQALTRLLDWSDDRQPQDEARDTDLEPDGGYDTLHAGTRRSTVDYGLDPETGPVLSHTAVNDRGTIPFFADERTARAILENRADIGDANRYAGLRLYKARIRKVADAVDVLTEQTGFDEYVPDDG